MDPLLSTFLPGEGRRRRRGGKGFVTEGCSTTPELDRYRGRLSFLGPWNWRRKSIERMPSSPPLSSLLESLQPSRKTGTTVFTPVLDVIRLRIRVSLVIVPYPLSPSKEEVSLSLSLSIDLRDSNCCCYDSKIIYVYHFSFSLLFFCSQRDNRDREESDFLAVPR